jgi:predicted Zn-ribbon and HTH transcriptional regulator
MSRRTRIIDLLVSSEVALTAREISRDLGIHETTVVRDLKHIARSLSRRGDTLMTRPANCAECGFTFSPKASSPGKCPFCRSTQIRPPAFIVGVNQQL